MAFRGHYEHSLDAKHRLSIPSRFRDAFSDGLVLSKDTDACITVWTPEAHEATVSRALAGKNPLGRDYKQIQRFFQGNSFEAELDSRRPRDPAAARCSRTRGSRRRSWSPASATTSSCGRASAGPSSRPCSTGASGR